MYPSATSRRPMQARKEVSQRESLNGLTSCHHKGNARMCAACGRKGFVPFAIMLGANHKPCSRVNATRIIFDQLDYL
jgi:hypothetical protein